MTSSEKTTVTLTVDYNHQLKLSTTLHTIVATFEGPDSDCLREALLLESYITSGENDTLRHGQYVYISYGYRNLITRLQRIGMLLDDILLEGSTAAEFLKKMSAAEN